MKGAMTVPCERTKMAPKTNMIIRIGISQYFFLALRNAINSIIKSMYFSLEK